VLLGRVEMCRETAKERRNKLEWFLRVLPPPFGVSVICDAIGKTELRHSKTLNVDCLFAETLLYESFIESFDRMIYLFYLNQNSFGNLVSC
jgi:hypothetical protein